MDLLRKLWNGTEPAADTFVDLPQHFTLVIGELRIAAEWLEIRRKGDDIFSQGYVLTGPNGGQYALWDDAVLVPWEKAGLILSNVAGVTHHKGALQAVAFAPSREVILGHEPLNQFDPNAVAVWDLGKSGQLGYLPKDLTIPPLAPRVAGHRAFVIREYREVQTNRRVAVKLVMAPGLALDIPDD